VIAARLLLLMTAMLMLLQPACKAVGPTPPEPTIELAPPLLTANGEDIAGNNAPFAASAITGNASRDAVLMQTRTLMFKVHEELREVAVLTHEINEPLPAALLAQYTAARISFVEAGNIEAMLLSEPSNAPLSFRSAAITAREAAMATAYKRVVALEAATMQVRDGVARCFKTAASAADKHQCVTAAGPAVKAE
jgi:hypothetical protein